MSDIGPWCIIALLPRALPTCAKAAGADSASRPTAAEIRANLRIFPRPPLMPKLMQRSLAITNPIARDDRTPRRLRVLIGVLLVAMMVLIGLDPAPRIAIAAGKSAPAEAPSALPDGLVIPSY